MSQNETKPSGGESNSPTSELVSEPVSEPTRYRKEVCYFPTCLKYGIYKNDQGVHACFIHKSSTMHMLERCRCSVEGCTSSYSKRVKNPDGTYTKYCSRCAPKDAVGYDRSHDRKCTFPSCNVTGSFMGGKPGYRCAKHQLESDTIYSIRSRCTICNNLAYHHNPMYPNMFRCKYHKIDGDVVCIKQFKKVSRFIGSSSSTAQPKASVIPREFCSEMIDKYIEERHQFIEKKKLEGEQQVGAKKKLEGEHQIIEKRTIEILQKSIDDQQQNYNEQVRILHEKQQICTDQQVILSERQRLLDEKQLNLDEQRRYLDEQKRMIDGQIRSLRDRKRRIK